MKSEAQEMIEQMEEMVEPLLAMAQTVYRKMGQNKAMWKDLAECSKTAVAAFEEAGFNRAEAITMAANALNNVAKK